MCLFLSFLLLFFFEFFLFSYWRRDIYLGLEEWCWSSCSLHRLPVVTSLADDSQFTDQNKWRGTRGVHRMSPNWSRSEANQNSSKVQYCSFLHHIFLSLRCSLFFFSYFLPIPSAPLFLFYFFMSLSVQWMTCLLLANIMPLLTGLAGSQSHTMQKCLQTWLWRSCSSFSLNFLYRGGGCHYHGRLERILFALVALTLVFLWEVR